MGAIKSALDSISTTDEKEKKELGIQLDNMAALAKAKADYFELKLRQDLNNVGSGPTKEIPVEFIIDFTRQTHAYSSSNADNISTTITDAVENFVNGGQENVLKGVGGLMTKAVRMLFASKDGGEDQIEFMSVFSEGRALVRLDLKAWKRFTNVEKLSKSAEQISAFVMCKSIIKAEALDYSTFIQIYQRNLYDEASGFTAAEISDQLEAISFAFEEFKKYQKENNKDLLTTSEYRFSAPSEAELEEAENAVIKAEQALL